MPFERSESRETFPPGDVPTLPTNADPASSQRHERSLPLLMVLVFVSGACALVYQVAWFRELRLIFGLSTAANSAATAAFMAGLGVGGWWWGARADRSHRSLRLYGRLELAIAVLAFLSPFLLDAARALYLASGGQNALGGPLANLLRLFLTALVLGPITAMMGGTLPALARAVERPSDERRSRVAWIYGLNTLGAVTGAMLASFWLLETFGNTESVLLGVVANLVLAVFALRLDTWRGPDPEFQAETLLAPVAAEGARQAPSAFVYAAACAVGFVFFLMEMVWFRMLVPILGGTTFTFGLILAVALLGIGLGAAFYAVSQRDGISSASLAAFAVTCALEGAFLASAFALGDRLAVAAMQLRQLQVLGFGGLVTGWSLIAAAVILPAAVVAGYQFPLLISLLGRGRDDVGRQVGLAYAWNTAGAIVGSLAGGFWFLPQFGAIVSWKISVAFCVVLALLALMIEVGRSGPGQEGLRNVLATRKAATATALGAASLATLALGGLGPTAVWRHAEIGAGRGSIDGEDPNAARRFLHEERRTLIWEADGVETSVGVESYNAYSFLVGGKVDGNSIVDAPTQIMLGLMAVLLHPEPAEVAVIGLGTGSTAGWIAAVPEVESVDVIELEPKIRTVAEMCAPVNQNVLDNPKVNLRFGDGREALLTSDALYDVVVSEPSNPYRAGIASLFTVEFYEAAAHRLEPGGIFAQWLPAYEVDTSTVATAIRTVATVFPEVEMWRTMRQDLVLLASREPIAHDVDRMRRVLATEPWPAAMRNGFSAAGLEALLAHFEAAPALTGQVGDRMQLPINTDDRNMLEYRFARTLGSAGLFEVSSLHRSAVLVGAGRPELDGRVNWNLVARERVAAFGIASIPEYTPASDEQEGVTFPRSTLEELGEFHRQWRFGHNQAALEVWESFGWQVATREEQLGLAAITADLGRDDALTYHEGLHPVDAATLRAQWNLRRGQHVEALGALRQAVAIRREDPWGEERIERRMFRTIEALAAAEPSMQDELERLLSLPFSVERAREERVKLRLRLATGLSDERYVEALATVEPWVPWEVSVLQRRALAYRRTGDARAGEAARQLEELLRYRAFGLEAYLDQ